jgi:hypothetical protein
MVIYYLNTAIMKSRPQQPGDEKILEQPGNAGVSEQAQLANAASDNDSRTLNEGTAIPEDSDLEDDGTPVLDEQDLDENNLSEEDADDIEWETDQSS